MPPKVSEVLRRLRQEGWRQVRQTGSHRHFKHPDRSGTVTVPGHPNEDVAPDTWSSIPKQAGWR